MPQGFSVPPGQHYGADISRTKKVGQWVNRAGKIDIESLGSRLYCDRSRLMDGECCSIKVAQSDCLISAIVYKSIYMVGRSL